MVPLLKRALIILIFICLCLSQNYGHNFDKEIFKSRRVEFMKKMNGGIAVFKGEETKTRNSDITYRFRQNSDFYYLTGVESPGVAFILLPDGDKNFIMFYHDQNIFSQIMEGKHPGVSELMNVYGADTAYVMDDFEKVFSQYVRDKEKIYYCFGDDEFDKKISSAINPERNYKPNQIIDPRPIIHEMRLIKDEKEIELLQKAIDITESALIESMKAIEPGMNEGEVEAIINYVFRKNGSPRHGFYPIVSSGKNLVIGHYQDNNSVMPEGSLAMMDIGAEYGYYSADVARTVPVNGKFTDKQKELYEIALKATDEEINMIAPGVGINELNRKAFDVLGDGLLKLGLITNKSKFWQIRLYFPAYSLHYIGLDTHDAGEVKYRDPKGKILKPGMVFAVEPGIYVNKELFEMLPQLAKMYMPNLSEKDVNEFMKKVRPAVEKYAGICVRVEDDVLVTEDGHKVLSGKAPRTVEEIEALMAEKSILNEL